MKGNYGENVGKFVSESRNEITKDGSNKNMAERQDDVRTCWWSEKRINKGRGRMKEKENRPTVS